MNHDAASSQSDHTMLFGVKVKVEEGQKRSKTYLSVGIVCMLLAISFHVIGSLFEGELVSQLAAGKRVSATLEIQAWIRTCSSSSYICLWIAIMTLFQVAFQHRKALKPIG